MTISGLFLCGTFYCSFLKDCSKKVLIFAKVEEGEKMHTDKANIEILFKTHYNSLYVYAFQMINDAETCRDIVADAFEYLWKNYNRVELSTVKSYLYAYVRTRCIDLLRHRQIHERYIRFCMEVMPESDELGKEEPDERILRLRKVVRALTPRTRHILEECYVRKKKYQEVADALEISSSAVRKHIMQALAAMRVEFGEDVLKKDKTGA